MDIAGIQKALADERIDGWLLYDFRGTNPIARSVIGFDESQIGTRRWFYLIPRQGEPLAILHAIEPHALRGAPGKSVLYRSWKDLESLLKTHVGRHEARGHGVQPGRGHPLRGPRGRGHHRDGACRGPEVVSSADLVQAFEARWTPEQKELHDRAARDTMLAKDEAFALIKERLASGTPVKESEVQAFIQSRSRPAGS
jgi:Xaa-Pro aminopeptidase